MRENLKIIRKYWALLPNDRRIQSVLLGSKALASIANILIPMVVAFIINAMTERNQYLTLFAIFLFGVVVIVMWFFYYWNFKADIWCKNRNYSILKDRIFGAIQKYDLDFAIKLSPARILHTVSVDVEELGELNDNISDFFITSIKVIVVLLLAFLVNWEIGLVMTMIVLIYLFFRERYNHKLVYHLNKQKEAEDQIVELLTESLAGKSELEVYGMKGNYAKRFSQKVLKFREVYRKKRHYNDIFYAVLPFIGDLGSILLYVILLLLLFQGSFGIDTIVLITGYYAILLHDLNYLETVSNKIKMKDVSIDRILKVLRYHSSDMLSFGNNQQDNIIGRVRFEHVSASYQGKKVLKGVSFTAQPNQITALVGKTGSGKTTIINLLLRLYERDSGNILIDRNDIQTFDSEVYFSNVSVVNQKPFVFSMSIRDNLSMVDQRWIHQEEVCRYLKIHDEILSLPDGYDTILEENGRYITTELKQFLSLARALLSKAEILIMDEITSSLGEKATIKISKILSELKENHTIILITHKPELMNLADYVVVINEGKLVGKGTPEELVKNPYYQKIQTYH